MSTPQFVERDELIPGEKRAPISGGKTAPVVLSGGTLGRWRARRTVSTHGLFFALSNFEPQDVT